MNTYVNRAGGHRRVLEIEWAVKNGRDFVPSPKKQRKVRGKKRKVAVERICEEATSMGQSSIGQSSLDDGEDGERGFGDGEGATIKVKEEYEGQTTIHETPAKRTRCEVKIEH